ncbi:hypothetical protein GA0061100_12334 [Rhizobium hainanense]|uniref:Uncharacterized protein n=1 Tax=Rhizobium hainanense TaxID=52131 RepID=A0A1C3WJM6_9HYPH|nr:hypothetical protein GA0061100_12334 [Rhizobium hainanense]
MLYLFRCFVRLSIDEAVWDASSFSKNRDRLLTTEIAQAFLWTACPACAQATVECGAFLDCAANAEGVYLDGELPPRTGSDELPGDDALWSVSLDDRAAFVLRPVSKTEIVGSNIVIPSPGSRDSSERGSTAAVTMRDDMVSRLEAGGGQEST